MRRMVFTLLVLVVALASIRAGRGRDEDEGRKRPPAGSDQGQALEFFGKRVKELTKGEIEIQAFHSQGAGPPPTQYKNTIAGAQDLVVDTLDYFKSYDDRFGVINTPFVFRDREHFSKYLNSKAFAEIAEVVENGVSSSLEITTGCASRTGASYPANRSIRRKSFRV